MATDLPSILANLQKPVDSASGAFFRIAFGLLMAADLLFYALEGRLERLYYDPVILFKYPLFAWVEPAPLGLMKALVWTFVAAALAVALGYFYRLAAWWLFFGLTYVFLLEATAYNNHNYLFCLLALLVAVLPLHRYASLDARRKPGLRSTTSPAWVVWLLRFQVGVPYFFGGLAKLNYDWMVRAEPMALWLRTNNLGGTFNPAFFREPWAAYFFSWTGVLFDLLIVPALIWPRSRPWAFGLLIVFNLANAQIFDIGAFPWVMIALSTIYFAPRWPRRAGFMRPLPSASATAAATAKKPNAPRKAEPAPAAPITDPAALPWPAWLLVAYLAWQLLMPVRHVLYPGNVDWTDEAHRYSWRMKLRDKQGEVRFMLVKPDQRQSAVLEGAEDLLTQRQRRFLDQDPELMRQFAHFLAKGLRDKGHENFEIHAFTNLSLNERPAQALIDPDTDLAAQPPSIAPRKWIVPLKPL